MRPLATAFQLRQQGMIASTKGMSRNASQPAAI